MCGVERKVYVGGVRSSGSHFELLTSAGEIDWKVFAIVQKGHDGSVSESEVCRFNEECSAIA